MARKTRAVRNRGLKLAEVEKVIWELTEARDRIDNVLNAALSKLGK